MRVAALVENTTKDKRCRRKHGLCLYIETAKHKALFDLGPDGTFLRNADTMGVDIPAVDTVVISHGHSDHGGALARFLQVNQKATVYIHKAAFAPHYVKLGPAKLSVGLDAGLARHERVVLTDGTLRIDDELLLFADVDGQFNSRSNRSLYTEAGGKPVPDAFAHEQHLLVTQQGKTALFSGCSHRGIENILAAARTHAPHIHTAVGGFHLLSPAKVTEPSRVVQAVARGLAATDTNFYTCHCTGTRAYKGMKAVMGQRLAYLSAGTQVVL